MERDSPHVTSWDCFPRVLRTFLHPRKDKGRSVPASSLRHRVRFAISHENGRSFVFCFRLESETHVPGRVDATSFPGCSFLLQNALLKRESENDRWPLPTRLVVVPMGERHRWGNPLTVGHLSETPMTCRNFRDETPFHQHGGLLPLEGDSAHAFANSSSSNFCTTSLGAPF